MLIPPPRVGPLQGKGLWNNYVYVWATPRNPESNVWWIDLLPLSTEFINHLCFVAAVFNRNFPHSTAPWRSPPPGLVMRGISYRFFFSLCALEHDLSSNCNSTVKCSLSIVRVLHKRKWRICFWESSFAGNGLSNEICSRQEKVNFVSQSFHSVCKMSVTYPTFIAYVKLLNKI